MKITQHPLSIHDGPINKVTDDSICHQYNVAIDRGRAAIAPMNCPGVVDAVTAQSRQCLGLHVALNRRRYRNALKGQ
jgi:hypothetical protein